MPDEKTRCVVLTIVFVLLVMLGVKDWDQAKANERAARVAGELLDKLQPPPLNFINFSIKPNCPLAG